MIERERFDTLVLRLFNTELEAVYEEFNMGQDNDYRKLNKVFYSKLFPTNKYGTQTTIGRAEHLKNPSMYNIHKYFNKYYVPNNMAICLAGDLDFEQTFQIIKKHWSSKKRSEIAAEPKIVETPIAKPIEAEVFGPEAEFLMMGYRFGGETNSDDEKYVTLINSILYNRKAGLIDLNLNQKQKVLEASTYSSFMKEYGVHEFFVSPREGQKLEDAKNLVLEQIEKVKKGDFEDWMLEAAINNYKLAQIKQQESNSKAELFVDVFTVGKNWIDFVSNIDELEKITKQQLVDFANKNYKDNYVVVYKRTGEDKNVVKVDKPKITANKINRDNSSEFFKQIQSMKTPSVEPVFVDYKKEITFDKMNNIAFDYMKNKNNEIYSLQYVVEMGEDNNIKLPLAINYLTYLGTNKYTPEDFKKELYKLGLSLGVRAMSNRSYVYISGLDKSYEKGIELIEHLLANAVADKQSYLDYVDGILKERENAKLDKDAILWTGLYNYGVYGKFSPTTNILSESELKSINPKELTDILKEFLTYEHSIFYYGQKPIEEAKTILAKYHNPTNLKKVPAKIQYVEQETTKNKVYFVNYDMVQTNFVMLSKGKKLDNSLNSDIELFNEYFGGGMSSIVFQEIREAKALAYHAFANFSTPSLPTESHYLFGFVATQVDKLKIASDAMLDLLNNMPKAEKNFAEAKDAIAKRIETDRITGRSIYWSYKNNLDKGIDYDDRKDVYEKMKTVTINDLDKFYSENIKNKNYTFLVIGNKNNIDFNVLKQIGEVEELSLKDIFNY
jgi:predicted Zn-dependent peptidase